jgi:glycosyltransferase involved in cell wall biosynthesis
MLEDGVDGREVERRVQSGRRREVNPTARLTGLSVFLPALNEEGNIERVVRGFCGELPKVAANYEIIVVDDGSRDRTGEIVDRMATADPHIRVVHHERNQGYGSAVISGIKAARLPYVLLCDGDGQFDPADVELLAARIVDHDVVVGRRVRRADHLVRRINGKAWTLLVRFLFGFRLGDIDCGFKLFRLEFVQGIEFHAHGAMITTELLAWLTGRGARMCEVDVRHLPRLTGEQSGNSARVILRAFKELFVLYRDLRATRRRNGGAQGNSSTRIPREPVISGRDNVSEAPVLARKGDNTSTD